MLIRVLRILVIGIVALLVAIYMMGCTEEVDMVAYGPPVNIVYCLLNPGKETQYVRIGRSYNGASLDLNHSPPKDSITWNKDFLVYVEERDAQDMISQIYQFQPVASIEKDTGFFPVNGLSVYKSDFKPILLHTYNLYVHFVDDDKITSGTTIIPGKVEIIDPKPIPGRKINLQTGSNFTIRWKPVEKGGIYQSYFNITYKEIGSLGTEIKNILFHSSVFVEISPPLMLERTISGNRFISQCINQVDSTISATREVINVSFEMFVGGEDYGFFVNSQLGDNNLSTAFGEYTNLNNGIGIFSSVTKYEISNLELSNTTLDELAYSDKTRHLGFLDHYGKRTD